MKAWQEASSLILAARHGQTYGRVASPAVHNYKLLCLKRHQKSSFMPGLYVFPGGAVDPADANLKWRKHFTAFGLGDDKLASLVPRTVSRPQIFRSRENELLREISLRITAIRETFEECGILICRRDRDGGAHSGWAEHVAVPQGELQTWQSKVHEDATEFFNLCQRYECYPDLWALHEWRNWLTPTAVYEKRFDTAFYLACLPDVPHAEYEAKEMEDLKWDTPEKLSTMGITFPPPQQYEIARMTKVKSIDELLDIAVERNKEGSQLYLPISVYLKDGVMHVLPSDTMYPKKVELFEKQTIDKSDITTEEFQKISPFKNRTEFLDTQINVIFTDNGEDNRVSFPLPGYSKIAYGKEEPKNKL
ncbi:nucleoside diphosphate-linked moiety X motif 19-like [Monomorium pharaonis]|uniref:nucleoside diphosphate-linked moiety X motif 19-like n=1 Tax=Monomorium pharaonis TaxID=307658 RepID=UPI00063FA7A7|nr:nucleoside diphosphate-linked moiety X motif 19-like [Monomorium pharaonis]